MRGLATMTSVQPRSPHTSMLCRVCVRVLTREAYGNCRRVVKLQSLQETLYDGWVFLRDVILLQRILYYVKQPQVLFGSSFLTVNKQECFVITVVYVVLLTEVERCVRLVGRRNPRAWTLTRKQTQILLIMFSS